MILVSIPVELFDQVKLHTLVSKIPVAYEKTEKVNQFERKFFSYPKLDDKGFKINCQSDHYNGVSLPSKLSCELLMLTGPVVKSDEHLVEFTNPLVVKNFYDAISYGTDTKSIYSYERPYGKNLNGVYQRHFRYGLTCSIEKCQLTMSTAPASK